jgi:hypothetical protein
MTESLSMAFGGSIGLGGFGDGKREVTDGSSTSCEFEVRSRHGLRLSLPSTSRVTASSPRLNSACSRSGDGRSFSFGNPFGRSERKSTC